MALVRADCIEEQVGIVSIINMTVEVDRAIGRAEHAGLKSLMVEIAQLARLLAVIAILEIDRIVVVNTEKRDKRAVFSAHENPFGRAFHEQISI